MLRKLSLFVWCPLLIASTATAARFPTQSLPGVDIGNGLGAGYETSGIAWHSRLERFFLVDDGGQLSSMDADGNNVTHHGINSSDYEGITIADPSTNLIYVGQEENNEIYEYDFVAGKITASYQLRTWMTTPGSSGLEALTFVPDANDSEGGLFYAGQQSNGVVYAFRLPIVSRTPTRDFFQFSFQAATGRTDLSGLHFDDTNDVLYAIWDSDNFLRAMQPDGTFIEEWILPGTRQEGITFQGTNLVIAQDNGPDAIRYSSFPIITVPEPQTCVLFLEGMMLLGFGRKRR
jgi:hypothetical protein